MTQTELNAFYKANSGMIYAAARSHAELRTQKGIPFAQVLDELLGSARLAFVKACHAFDPARGAEFSTFYYSVLKNDLMQADIAAKREKRPKVVCVDDEFLSSFSRGAATMGREDDFRRRLECLHDDCRTVAAWIEEGAHGIKGLRGDTIGRRAKAAGWGRWRAEKAIMELLLFLRPDVVLVQDRLSHRSRASFVKQAQARAQKARSM